MLDDLLKMIALRKFARSWHPSTIFEAMGVPVVCSKLAARGIGTVPVENFIR
ncbi:MAG: hypothetical protein V3U75_05730 [Methylococcaceae bacterium]